MFNIESIGKFLILVGITLLGVGLLLISVKHIPFLGKLPGDILIKKKNVTIFFPLTTSILVSIILSLVFYFFNKK